MNAGIELTWETLYPLAQNAAFGDDGGAELEPGVKVHIHPDTPFPREVHFMVDGMKVAVLGPPDKAPGEVLLGGYIYFLPEWNHSPDTHLEWWQAIAIDNGLWQPVTNAITEAADASIAYARAHTTNPATHALFDEVERAKRRRMFRRS